ncbi:hypothetical protein GCM10010425_82670 [Streptomyces spororaveus]|uniref:Uncharacterized protein n=1 Tax=Streptomyces spororaveus TaxID=284039 RepID=A0ABQ3T4C5_9ACTN|nr:hypothetical protein Sspor_04110 [Streptomyces spororaveus]
MARGRRYERRRRGLAGRPPVPAGEGAGTGRAQVPYGSGRQPVVPAGLPQDAGGKGGRGGARSGSTPPEAAASGITRLTRSPAPKPPFLRLF